jgi:hypothetical protein
MHVTNQIYAIDHRHGQASRTTLSSYPPIRGAIMADKAEYNAAVPPGQIL